MLFTQRKNFFTPSGCERWFGVDRQPPEFSPEQLRLLRLDSLSADSHQESVCNFGGPVRRTIIRSPSRNRSRTSSVQFVASSLKHQARATDASTTNTAISTCDLRE